jgi:hypothetical protein
VRAGTPAARTRARLARAHQYGHTEQILGLERQLRIDIAADYLQQVIDGWPPPTAEDIAALQRILSPGIVLDASGLADVGSDGVDLA